MLSGRGSGTSLGLLHICRGRNVGGSYPTAAAQLQLQLQRAAEGQCSLQQPHNAPWLRPDDETRGLPDSHAACPDIPHPARVPPSAPAILQYEAGSAPALALQATIEKTERRFDKCVAEGLPAGFSGRQVAARQAAKQHCTACRAASFRWLSHSPSRLLPSCSRYANQGLLCGTDGLPHLIADPGLALRYGHAGDVFVSGRRAPLRCVPLHAARGGLL